MKKLNNILVAVDFSNNSKSALETAKFFAKKFKAQLHLIFAAESAKEFSIGPVFMYADTQYLKDFFKSYLKDQEKHLEKIAKKIKGVSLSHKVKTGKPFEVIVKEAKRTKADMIIMGTHGHSGLDHLIMGSTAERVLKKATCPVLVVKK